MSLTLDQDTVPDGIEIKMSGALRISADAPTRFITIGLEDFAELVVYTLTNTDIVPNDPRLRLMERLRRIRIVEGFNGERTQRLEVQGVPGDQPEGNIPGVLSKEGRELR